MNEVTHAQGPVAILEELKNGLAMGQNARLVMERPHIVQMIAALEARPDPRLVSALERAARVFRDYGKSHQAKADRAWLPGTQLARLKKAHANYVEEAKIVGLVKEARARQDVNLDPQVVESAADPRQGDPHVVRAWLMAERKKMAGGSLLVLDAGAVEAIISALIRQEVDAMMGRASQADRGPAPGVYSEAQLKAQDGPTWRGVPIGGAVKVLRPGEVFTGALEAVTPGWGATAQAIARVKVHGLWTTVAIPASDVWGLAPMDEPMDAPLKPGVRVTWRRFRTSVSRKPEAYLATGVVTDVFQRGRVVEVKEDVTGAVDSFDPFRTHWTLAQEAGQ
jgi:hypothetical protein